MEDIEAIGSHWRDMDLCVVRESLVVCLKRLDILLSQGLVDRVGGNRLGRRGQEKRLVGPRVGLTWSTAWGSVRSILRGAMAMKRSLGRVGGSDPGRGNRESVMLF